MTVEDSGVAKEGEIVWICINPDCPDIGLEIISKEPQDCPTCHERMEPIGPAL